MAYAALDPQPANLQTGEIGLQLSGSLSMTVAAKVEKAAAEVGSGMVFTGTVRWIDSNGNDATFGGQTVSVTFSHNASGDEVSSLTAPAISKELTLALIAESPTLDGDGNPLILWDYESIVDIGEAYLRVFNAGMANLFTALGL